MPKEAKTDAEWEFKLNAFAFSGEPTLSRGETPSKGTRAYAHYEAIQNCPRHVVRSQPGSGQQSNILFFLSSTSAKAQRKTVTCSCGRHGIAVPEETTTGIVTPTRRPEEVTPKRRAPPLSNPHRPAGFEENPPCTKKSKPLYNPYNTSNPYFRGTGAPKPTPPYSKGCSLPIVPDHKQYGVAYCRDNPVEWIKKDGFLDLLIFAPLTGYCPYCFSGRIKSTRICTYAKLVYTNGWPMYCLGIDIDCTMCSRAIKSIDSRYVVTLPREDRLAMPFLQTGQSHGVHRDLIQRMRLGWSAAGVEADQRASLRSKYEFSRALYVAKAKKITANKLTGYDRYEPFPQFPERWVASGAAIMAAFLRDFEINRADLCRELQSITTTSTLAVDHQRKVVKKVKKDHQEGESGKQTFVICGDEGVILNYCVVPDTAAEWTDELLCRS
jgi:hypothetical protein